MHKPYKDIGKAIATGWGPSVPDSKTMDDMVKAVLGDRPFSSDTKTLVCLLAAIHEQLVRLNITQASILDKQQHIHSELGYLDNGSGSCSRSKRDGDVSDGMLNAMRRNLGPIAVADYSAELPTRARLALRRANITYVEEISEKRLFGVRQCGVTTTNQLMDFRDRILGRPRSKADVTRG